MEKEQLLITLKGFIQKGQITKDEVLSLFEKKKEFSLNVVNILYGIGGIVILAGIIALVAQNWDVMSGLARILITLGMGAVLYISSILLIKGYNSLSQILMAVSFILFPIGIGVVFSELKINPDIGMISFIIFLLTIFALITYFLVKRVVVGSLFSVIFGTIFIYSLLAVIDVSSFKAYLYLTIALGILHGSLASIFRKMEYSHARLGQLLYSTATLGVLIPAVSLGGVWDVLFVFVVVGTFLYSVRVHSRGMLILSSLFLIGYIFKITNLYFAGSIGWPVALIFIGIATIAIAIFTFRLNQKYFNHAELRS